MERISDYIVRRLTEKNIKNIFLVTGRGVLYLTDAIARNPAIKAISTYHEQGASYAAMAYALSSGDMAACLVSTGCAATNAITAALCAWQDNLPILFISGQHMLHETTRYTGLPIRTYGSQEADIISLVKPITKYAVMLTEPEKIPAELDKAFCEACSERKGPVWLDIPLDVQNMRINADNLNRYEEIGDPEAATENMLLNEAARVAQELSAAERPLILIGGGVRSAGAENELKEYVETNGIPVVFSHSASDIYGSYNQYSVGAIGSIGGSRAGNFAVQNADYVLAVGTKLCSQSIGAFPEQFSREAKVVVVDIDKKEHKKSGVMFERVIIADAKAFIIALSRFKLLERKGEWLDKCGHWKDAFSIRNEAFIKSSENGDIDLYALADELSEQLPGDATVITDAGLEELIIPSAIRFKSGQRCLFPAAQGAMGYAIPAVIGAHFAGRKNIIVVVGDGSIMMNIQELQLISSLKIPAKIFVINNNMYAVIRKRQKDLFRTRTIGNDPSDGLPAPDFQKISAGFGIQYRRIINPDRLEDSICEVIDSEGACLCEVMCKKDQKYLHMSYAFNDSKKLVKRPLEDLSPFIDRELFKAEMIVEPLEESL